MRITCPDSSDEISVADVMCRSVTSGRCVRHRLAADKTSVSCACRAFPMGRPYKLAALVIQVMLLVCVSRPARSQIDVGRCQGGGLHWSATPARSCQPCPNWGCSIAQRTKDCWWGTVQHCCIDLSTVSVGQCPNNDGNSPGCTHYGCGRNDPQGGVYYCNGVGWCDTFTFVPRG